MALGILSGLAGGGTSLQTSSSATSTSNANTGGFAFGGSSSGGSGSGAEPGANSQGQLGQILAVGAVLLVLAVILKGKR
jgi:hypothetical protein